MKILIAIPVYNEELILKENILKLYNFLKENIQDDWQIIIADNGSTDNTGKIGQEFSQNFDRIKYLFIKEKGKGRAIRTAWQNEDADIYCFMDADLSTDLSALPILINAISQGNYDLAIGSRFLPGSKVRKSFLRKTISHGYRFFLKLLFGLKVKDVPCGFKACNPKIIKNVLPQILNNEWFFDTELIVLAEKQKYKIKEIPVKWAEHKQSGRKSRINLFRVINSYLKELWKLKKRNVKSKKTKY